jgi:hypothetical protein
MPRAVELYLRMGLVDRRELRQPLSHKLVMATQRQFGFQPRTKQARAGATIANRFYLSLSEM